MSEHKRQWRDVKGEKLYGVGELAREFGITTRAIRFYEEQGFVKPLRRGRTRFFRQRDRVRLRLVLRGKRLGFSLAEIAEIIFMYDAEPGESGQLYHFLGKIAERRKVLASKQRDIELALRELDDVEQRCRQRLAQLGENGAKAGQGDVD